MNAFGKESETKVPRKLFKVKITFTCLHQTLFPIQVIYQYAPNWFKNESTSIFLQSSLHKILPRELPFFISFLGCWKGIHKSSQKDYICKDNMSLMNNIFWTIILLKKYTQISEFHVITISSRYRNPCSIMVDLSVGIINLLCWKDFLSQQDINQILNFADVTKSTLAISRKPSFKLQTIS